MSSKTSNNSDNFSNGSATKNGTPAASDTNGDSSTPASPFANPPRRSLLEKHRQDLYASGLTDETIARAGFYTENDREALARLAGRNNWPSTWGPAMVIPFYDENAELATRRLKPSVPVKMGKNEVKYLSPRGGRNHAYIPPDAWRAVNDPGARLLITEGEKKALSATQHGFASIAATGVHSWHKKKSFEMLPELQHIKWKDREVYVAFDSDAADNPHVLRAERQLAAALQARGAKVKIIRLPADGDKKVGLDDFLVANEPGELEKLIKKAEEPDPPEADEVKQCARDMDPGTEARAIIELDSVDGMPRLRFWNDTFLLWKGGRYVEMLTSEVRALATKHLDDNFYGVTTSHTSNLVDMLKAHVLLPSSVQPNKWLGGPNEETDVNEFVAMKNGIVHLPKLVNMDEGYKLKKTPLFFTRNACEFGLDIDAPEPEVWLSFLDSLWDDDPQSIEALQDWFGYCLTGDTKHDKMINLIGPIRSGKGTIARTLAAIVGKSNTSSPTLSSLGTQFGLEPLIGKALAVIGDARAGHRADESLVVERLLNMTGNDSQTIDRKNRTQVEARLHLKIMLLSNELPRLRDSSGAIASRAIMLNFEESFLGREDKNLEKKYARAARNLSVGGSRVGSASVPWRVRSAREFAVAT